MSRGANFTIEHPCYSIGPAFYAKGKVHVFLKKEGDGFKTDVCYLVEACGGKWTHREGGYLMSVPQAKKFIEHFERGTKTKIVFDSVYSCHTVLDDEKEEATS